MMEKKAFVFWVVLYFYLGCLFLSYFFRHVLLYFFHNPVDIVHGLGARWLGSKPCSPLRDTSLRFCVS